MKDAFNLKNKHAVRTPVLTKLVCSNLYLQFHIIFYCSMDRIFKVILHKKNLLKLSISYWVCHRFRLVINNVKLYYYKNVKAYLIKTQII